jgi:putative inorganic carbon (HCO3(-)) transporter
MISWFNIQRNKALLWGMLVAYVAFSALMIYFQFYYAVFIPAVLLFVILALISVDKYLMAIVLFVPLSIPLSQVFDELSIDMYLPTEPMLAGLLLLFFIKYLMGDRIDTRILRHPVTLAVYFYLAWMFITSLTSTDPLVSFKLLASRLWFVVGFYLLAAQIFKKEQEMQRYVWLFILSFTGVVLYTIINHAQHGLDNQVMAHSVCRPFYKDHTSYGATLGLVLPVAVGLFLLIRKENMLSRVLMILLMLLLGLATVVSYTRATWLSIIAAVGVWVLIKTKIRLEIVLVGTGILLALFFSVRPQLIMEMERNRVESSGELGEHVQSMSNISTDQSNLERINRWSCAYRMWKDKPVFGFGPGTYQFEYGSYQRSYEKTRISTDFGTRGNAHSEYLGPLSEGGIFGLLSILLVIGTTVYTGIRVYYTANQRRSRVFSLAILIGLATYYFHGFLNNFLDTDKISVLFWGYTAMLVAMDIYHVDVGDDAPGDKKVGEGT